MYFTPVLFAIVTILLFPSYLTAALVGFASMAYMHLAGQKVASQTTRLLRGQIAYRLLSVKLLSLNGEMDEDTFRVHAQLTPDEPENSELRGDLRNAAVLDGSDWKDQARIVRQIYGRDPVQIVDRLDKLLVQMNATPHGVTEDSQARIVEISKLWKIGREKTIELFQNNHVAPTQETLVW